MAYAYTIKDQFGQYFITCTVHQWADVFTRKLYIDILLDSDGFSKKKVGSGFGKRGIMEKRSLLRPFLRLNYIHLNPVCAGFVEKEEEYIYSSCGDYYGVRVGLLKLEVEI